MSELIPVSGGPRAMADVIFVHGLDGDAHKTWQTAQADGFWPLWLGGELPEVAVWTLDYDAHALKWTGASMPLIDRATNVLDLLEVTIPTPRPVFFVAHSLGGLLVKQMIRRAVDRKRALARNARGVVFLATPHSGSQKASWLTALGGILGTTVTARELEAHSAELRDLDIWYRDKVGELGILHRIYYETRATKGLKIVDETSADPGIPGVAPVALDEDHISICKPATRGNQMYRGVVQFVRQGLGIAIPGASPIKARFQVKPFDGRAATDVGGFAGALPDGAKFRLQLTNTGSDRALIDTLRLTVTHHALPAATAPRIDGAALRFGDARVPHQLHLELTERGSRGRWVIQMGNGDAELRSVSDGLENLLDTEPPTEFDLAPGSSESLTGTLTAIDPGIYEVNFSIEAVVLGEAVAPLQTHALVLVRF